MGLVNWMVEQGEMRAAALELARQLAAFPQRCLRSDRMSAYEGSSLVLKEALANEYRHGIATIESRESQAGAERFRTGAGRHGKF